MKTGRASGARLVSGAVMVVLLLVAGATTGGATAQRAAVPSQVSAVAAATLSDTNLVPGQVITVRGDHWRAAANVQVTLYPGGHRVTTTVAADGTFSTSFDIPVESRTGDYGITIGGAGADNLYAYLQNKVTITAPRPTAQLAKRSVVTGEALHITGERWKHGGSIQLTLYPSKVRITVTAGGDGSLNADFVIPSDSKTGTYGLTVGGAGADGLYQYLQNELKITAPRPTGHLSDTTLQPGQVINVSGDRWKHGGKVQVTLYPGKHRVEVFAGEDGHFSTKFDVPKNYQKGTYGITIGGGGADGLYQYLQNLVTIGTGRAPIPGTVIAAIPPAPEIDDVDVTTTTFPLITKDSDDSNTLLIFLLVLLLVLLTLAIIVLSNHPKVRQARLRRRDERARRRAGPPPADRPEIGAGPPALGPGPPAP